MQGLKEPKFIITVPLSNDAIGYVVVDTLFRGTSSGGLRVAEDLDIDEVQLLAREMSLKFAFVGLPRGGAKSGVRLPTACDKETKRRILREFGEKIDQIICRGIYYPGMDMNCGPEDLRSVYAGAGINIGSVTDTSFHTALTVESVLLAIKALEEKKRPMTIAIEGFGAVASHLCRRLSPDDFRIIAVSTIAGAVCKYGGFDSRDLVSLRELYGDNFITYLVKNGMESIEPKERLLTLETDILLPSARIHALNDGNSGAVCARYIVPVSNAPYAEGALSTLHSRGIVCLPGFACNVGGVLGSSLEDLGLKRKDVERCIMENYYPTIVLLLEISKSNQISPSDLALKITLARLENRGRNSPYREGLLRKLARRGLWPKEQLARRDVSNIKHELSSLYKELQDFKK